MRHPHRSQRTLLLTLDAFGTIFHPRQPVPEQYASAAHTFGLSRSTITPERLASAFKSVFKAQAKSRPNYGREDVLRGRYGGPRLWWGEVIRGSFARVLTDNSTSTTTTTEIPDSMVQHLLDRFASREGYALYEDVDPFFSTMRDIKKTMRGLGPFDRVLVGVISNSDDRVPAVLKSLGLRVGDVRADQGISSMQLPGFEERRGSSAQDQQYSEDARANDDVDDIDLVITSYKAGEEKPSRAIFEVAKRQAQRLLGATGDAHDWVCVHVGDDYDKDYQAALNAGWNSYFLPRGISTQDLHGVKAIHSLMELVPEMEAYR